MSDMIIAWWSAGVTSAVACKLAIEEFGKDRVRPIYFQIDTAHPDNTRFKTECEEWYGKNIEIYQAPKYQDQFDVIRKTKYINGPAGARCTTELKKKVRQSIEKHEEYKHQVFGFEFSKKEINRAIRFSEQYPTAKPLFPLIENKITKPNCLYILERTAKIKRPAMYTMGYSNNNCIGCVKGGAGYWNKIRKDFPETFAEMGRLEREIGATCLRQNGEKLYLDTLDPSTGHKQKIIMPDCGSFCEIEFEQMTHPLLDRVFKNPETLRELI